MTWQVLVTVFTLGGLGSMVRGSIIFILASSARIFPMAVVIVNLLAAYLGGFILKLNLPEGLNAALAIGLIGGIGTLSAIHGNLLDLFFDKAYRRLALYLGLTIFGGVLCAQAGMSTGNFIVELLQGPQRLQNQMMIDNLEQQKQFLEQLKHSEHLDYDNLPQLSPIPDTSPLDEDAKTDEGDAAAAATTDSLMQDSVSNDATKDSAPANQDAADKEDTAPVESDPSSLSTASNHDLMQDNVKHQSLALGA